ncbi:MAG: thioredoxin family protein [Spirulinaceae cyanobacterium]
MSQFSETHPLSVGDRAPDFELPGVDSEVHHLTPYCQKYQAVATIFLSNSCPVVQGYLERLKHLQKEFQSQGVIFIGINANDTDKAPQDSFESMKTFAAEHDLNFPYLRDPSQDVAQSFGATITPEVFLLDREGFIRYHGAIDDNPKSPEKVEQFYLRDAIAAVLENRPVTPQLTEAIGCALQWRG